MEREALYDRNSIESRLSTAFKANDLLTKTYPEEFEEGDGGDSLEGRIHGTASEKSLVWEGRGFLH